MAVQYEIIASGMLQCNSTVLWNPATLKAVWIDPTDNPSRPLAFIREKKLEVSALLLTHAHFDHAVGAEEAMAAVGKTARLHPDDNELYQAIPFQAQLFGANFPPRTVPIGTLSDGERLVIDDGFELEVLHLPGHSPGSVAFYVESESVLVGGDTLFYGAVGRTDLIGGSWGQLVKSIQERLYTLPEACTVITGHGPTTTIGREKRLNPFVQTASTHLTL